LRVERFFHRVALGTKSASGGKEEERPFKEKTVGEAGKANVREGEMVHNAPRK